MDSPAGSRTFAGVEQKVVFFLGVFQAYLARVFLFLFSLFLLLRNVLHHWLVGADAGLAVLGGAHFVVDAHFAHEELDPSEFDALAWL